MMMFDSSRSLMSRYVTCVVLLRNMYIGIQYADGKCKTHVVSGPAPAKVKTRRWFSWLVRFRGLSQKGSDEELEDIPFSQLDDPTRSSKFGGLDSSWTTDLKLNLMCCDIKGKNRLTWKKLGFDEMAEDSPCQKESVKLSKEVITQADSSKNNNIQYTVC